MYVAALGIGHEPYWFTPKLGLLGIVCYILTGLPNARSLSLSYF